MTADLYAHPSFRIKTDHARKRIYVSGAVGNRGNLPSLRAVDVAVGVTVRIRGVLLTSQRIVRFGPNFRPGGVVFTEPTLRAPLAYFNEDNGAKYLFETLVDINYETADASRYNNYQSYTWWAIEPRLFDSGESFVFGNIDEDGTPSVPIPPPET